MSFDGKVALVTGGTSGIGRETAIQFAKAGARVVLAGRRTEAGEAVVNEITSAGGQAHFVQTDVTKEDQVQRLVEETAAHFGRLDIAFNNAGIEHGGPVTEFTVEDYRKVFDINVLGVFLSQKYDRPFRRRRGQRRSATTCFTTPNGSAGRGQGSCHSGTLSGLRRSILHNRDFIARRRWLSGKVAISNRHHAQHQQKVEKS